MPMKLTNFKAEPSVPNKPSAILGTFEGECALASMINLNGMYIPRDVWVKLFASDDFKRGIEHKWYIGFLGHPADPECQEFKEGCIIMVDGSIDDNDVVHGKFLLINTPVGRVVKTYIDAGVEFGISVRGLGDLMGNTVDADTFIFKGFDLVAFPAYPDSIPVFSEIAASTDSKRRQAYKKICASVTQELSNINSCEALDIIQQQFAPQSEEYECIQTRKEELSSATTQELVDMLQTKLDSMTSLYLQAVEDVRSLQTQIEELQENSIAIQSAYSRKLKAVQRITSNQIADLQKDVNTYDAENTKLRSINASLKSDIVNKGSSIESLKRRTNTLKSLEATLSNVRKDNLKYVEKIDSLNTVIASKDTKISNLTERLDKTVVQANKLKEEASNRDVEISALEKRLQDREKVIADYQQAYADMYANAVGIHLSNIPVTASTTVSELKRIIRTTPSNSIQDILSTPDVVDYEDSSYTQDDIITM